KVFTKKITKANKLVLKESMNYTQVQANVIISVGNLAWNIGQVAGYIYSKYGPRTTSFCALVISTIGQLLFWLSVSKMITGHYIFMTFVYFMIGQGLLFTYMVAMLTPIYNFDKKRHGIIFGLQTAVLGGLS